MTIHKFRMADSLITTRTRLNAVPAPKVRPGEMGVRYDGRSAAPQEQADLDQLAEQVAASLDLLSADDLATVRAILRRYGGNSPRSAAGISTSDALDNAGRQIVGGVRDRAGVRDALRAGREVRANENAIAVVSRTYADFWDKHLADGTNPAR